MIKAITFDLDGVYFTKESFQNFKRNLPKTVNDLDKINQVLYSSPQMRDFKTGKLTESEYWQWASSQLGITVPLELISQILAESYVIDPAVANYVRDVRGRGIKTCICSNNFPTRVAALASKFNFLQDFDVAVFSYQAGVLKPDPLIFRSLVHQLQLDPSQVAYSDDDPSKLEGATALGIHTFTYQSFPQFIQELERLGVPTIT